MYRRWVKPLIDRSLALVLLVLLSPVIGIVAAVVYISLGRPVLFVQKRPGLNEKVFRIYKFRTMSDERDERGVLLPDAQRLKGVGKTIRSLGLDELPQLWNILKGEMSFIGPRPLLTDYLPLYNDEQRKRHLVKPGLTGWAQVNGRNAVSWEERFAYDVWYVEHLSFRLDMKIVWMTAVAVLKKRGATPEDAVTMKPFEGTQR